MSQSQSSLSTSQSSVVVSYKKGTINGKCINRNLVETNWTRVSMDDTTYKCLVCGMLRKQKDKSGHGNLVSHLVTFHPNLVNEQVEDAGIQPTLDSFVSPKASQVYRWIDFMTLKDIPFSWSKPGETNQYLKLDTMDPRTIKNFMQQLKHVEDLLADDF